MDNAGGYFDFLKCAVNADNFMWDNIFREAFAEALGVGFDRADLRFHWDEARKKDLFFYYIYVDANGTWKGYPRKYSGDRVELLRYNSSSPIATAEVVQEVTLTKGIITIPDKIKAKMQAEMIRLGITIK